MSKQPKLIHFANYRAKIEDGNLLVIHAGTNETYMEHATITAEMDGKPVDVDCILRDTNRSRFCYKGENLLFSCEYQFVIRVTDDFKKVKITACFEDVYENEKYSFVINNNETLTTTVKGPVYQFSNINRRSEDPQPTLFNLVMHSSHHAFDRSKIHHQVHTTRDTSPVVELNREYGRNEAQFTSTWGGTAQKGFYKIDYKDNNTFKDAVQTAHSIAVLVKVENTGNSEAEADIVSSFGAQNGGFGIVVNKGKLQYHIYTGSGWQYIDSGVTPVADKYDYVVGTWSTDGTAKIYVDGVLKATRTDAGTSLTLPSETEQCIGIGGSITASGIERAFNGAVVIARLYDVVLTEQQVQKLYEKLTPIKDEPKIYTTTSGGKERHLKFIGTYGYEADKKAPKGSYFVSDGKMYHLTSEIDLYGFRGYIVETDAQGNPLEASQTQTLSLRVKSADGTLTDIDPVVAETRESAAQSTYNPHSSPGRGSKR